MPVDCKSRITSILVREPKIASNRSSILKHALPILLTIFAGLSVALWRLGQTPLYDTEACFAEAGREMLESNDWLTPRFDYDRFLDKPPLFYWFLLPAYRLVGSTETMARLPTALAFAGCVALTVLAGFLLFDYTTAWLAGLFLATTMGFYVYSHAVLIEPLLTFWITASLISFWGYYRDTTKKTWLWTMYALFALGFLTKGLTALFFPVGIIAGFLLLDGGRRNLKPLLLWKGWLLFLGIVLPWHIWIAWHHPGYLWFYFINEQLFRFLALRTIKDSPLPTYVFVGLLIPLLFPWSLFLPQSLYFYFKKWRRERSLDRPTLFVLLWASVVILFFSVSKFKLDYYSLPAWPAIMLAIAHPLAARLDESTPWRTFSFPAAAVLCLSASGLLLFPRIVDAYHVQLPDPWLLAATGKALQWLLFGSLTAILFICLRKSRAALLCLAAMMVPLMGLAQQSMAVLGPLLSNKEIAQTAGRCLRNLPSATFAQAETDEDIYVGGDVFYTGRKVWLIMPLEKQVFPLGRSFYMTPGELAERWSQGKPVLLIGKADRVTRLIGERKSYFLSRSGDKILVANAPVCGSQKTFLSMLQK